MALRPVSPRRALRALGAVVAVALVGAPITVGGCGSGQACVRWSTSQGSCPDREKALAMMQAVCEQHEVTAVRSDGELIDGDACCYEVTQIDHGAEFVCAATGGPAPNGCGATVEGDCGPCAEVSCCSELLACIDAPGCEQCLGDRTSCSLDTAAAQLADQLTGCLAAAQCEGDPCGVNVTPPPTCTGGAPPSGGACVVIGGATECNPVTSAGCGGGLVCDRAPGGYKCVAQPLDEPLCGGCGATHWCGVGETCFGSLCARFCCDDGDCAGGRCAQDVQLALAPPVGICVQL